jgi:hypothetical protein
MNNRIVVHAEYIEGYGYGELVKVDNGFYLMVGSVIMKSWFDE